MSPIGVILTGWFVFSILVGVAVGKAIARGGRR